MKKGIDVSGNQGNINFKKVKEDGIDFIIIKFGNLYDNEENYKETKFETYYKNAKAQGLKVGIYVYNYCNSITNLKDGLDWLFNNLKNKELDLPIYLDMEDGDIKGESTEALTNMCNEFAKYVIKKGYRAGVYANLEWLTNELNPENFDESISVWVAQYYKECQYKGKYDIWQYTSEGKINGISGNVDLNYLVNDNLIKETTKEEETILMQVTVTHRNGLNLRKEPNTSSTILGVFSKGTILNISEVKGNWGKAGSGWVCLDYTSYNNNTESTKYTTGRYEVNTDVLTVRKESSTNAEWLRFSQLTSNAQKQIYEKCGYKPNGLCKRSTCRCI